MVKDPGELRNKSRTMTAQDTQTPRGQCGCKWTPTCIALVALSVLVLTLTAVLVVKNFRMSTSEDAPTNSDGHALADITRAVYTRWLMNRTALPCQDFYQYACGGLGSPRPLVRYLAAFPSGRAEIHRRLLGLMRQLNRSGDELPEDTYPSHLATFFHSCMNMSEIQRRGVVPLQELLMPFLSDLRWLKVGRSSGRHTIKLTDYLVETSLRANLQPLVEIHVDKDMKKTNASIVIIDQPSLNLNRHVYLQNQTRHVILAYTNLFVNLTQLLVPNVTRETAEERARKVVAFEMELAAILMTEKEQKDHTARYKKLTIHELYERYPDLNWLKLIVGIFRVAGVRDVKFTVDEQVICWATPYLDKLFPLLRKTPHDVLVNFFLWRLLYTNVGFMPGLAAMLMAAFNAKMVGVPRVTVGRADICTQRTTTLLPEPVGRLYRDRFLSAEDVAEVRSMTERVLHAFKEMLVSKDWISAKTKRRVVLKVERIRIQVGSRPRFRNDTELNALYRGLQLLPDDYFGNVRQIQKRNYFNQLSLLRRSSDDVKWPQTAAAVNAFYNMAATTIMIPAGIIMTPMYGRSFPKAMNYGLFGAVIGHEITHGFDARGRKFDVDGTLRPWWKDSDIRAFEARAQCFVRQYSQLKDRELETHGNGSQTLEENMADNGGLAAAYAAFTALLKESPDGDKTVPGLSFLSRNQLFFVSFAQTYCGQPTPEERLCKLHKDLHSLPEFRVLGALRNNLDFARAFHCPVGSPMNPRDKCVVW